MKLALENELIGVCFEPLKENDYELITKLNDENDEAADALAMSLATFLQAQAELDNDLVGSEVRYIDQDYGFKSILNIDITENTNKIISFSFKDAVADTFLPILGIAAALYYTPLSIALVPQIADLLKDLRSVLPSASSALARQRFVRPPNDGARVADRLPHLSEQYGAGCREPGMTGGNVDSRRPCRHEAFEGGDEDALGGPMKSDEHYQTEPPMAHYRSCWLPRAGQPMGLLGDRSVGAAWCRVSLGLSGWGRSLSPFFCR